MRCRDRQADWRISPLNIINNCFLLSLLDQPGAFNTQESTRFLMKPYPLKTVVKIPLVIEAVCLVPIRILYCVISKAFQYFSGKKIFFEKGLTVKKIRLFRTVCKVKGIRPETMGMKTKRRLKNRVTCLFIGIKIKLVPPVIQFFFHTPDSSSPGSLPLYRDPVLPPLYRLLP